MGAKEFAGKGTINITNCLAYSQVTTPDNSTQYLGGIIYHYRNPEDIHFNNCHYCMDYEITSRYSKEKGTYLSMPSEEDLKSISTYKGWDFKNIWMMGENGIPELKYFNQIKDDSFRLLASSPSDNEKNVADTANIVLFFSQSVSVDNDKVLFFSLKEGFKSVPIEIKTKGKKVTITPLEPLEGGEAYQLYIGKNAVRSTDVNKKEYNESLTENISISFSTERDTNFKAGQYVSWVNKSGFIKKAADFLSLKWLFSKDSIDKTKDLSYIPGTEDDEYVEEIKYWAEKYGVKDVKDATSLIDIINTNVEVPMKQQATDSIILTQMNDTTIKDLMRDVIFIEKMQELLEEADIDYGNSLSLKDMTHAYKKYNSYSQYTNYYLEARNNSNDSIFITTIVPILYNAFLTATDDNQGFKLYRNFYKASNLSGTVNDKIESCLNASEYNEYLESSKVVKSLFSEGKTLYQALSPNADNYYYKADGTVAKKDMSIVKFSSDWFSYIQSSNKSNRFWGKFDWLTDLKNAYSSFSSNCSAVKNCIYMGSSIGMFPLVIDLYNDMYGELSDEIKMFYFVSDYYIANNYPELYELCFDDDFYPNDNLVAAGLSGGFESYVNLYGDSEQIGEYLDNKDDPILKNWCSLIEKRVFAESYLREENISLRKELSNYATLCAFIQTIDTDELKRDIVKYTSSIINQDDVTTIMVACPVTVNVYNRSNGALEISVTDVEDISDDCVDVCAYIIGENNDTKCIVADMDKYYFEIIPYDDGEMNVLVLDENNQLRYSSVPFLTSDYFILYGNNTQYELVKNSSTTIEPDSGKLLYDLNLKSDDTICTVGETLKLYTACSPQDANCNLSFSLSDDAVGFVDDTQTFHATKEGTTTVLCTDETTHIASKIDICVLSSNFTEYNFDDIHMPQRSNITFDIPELSQTEIKSIQWYNTDPNVAILTDQNKLISFDKGITYLQTVYKSQIVAVKVVVDGYKVTFNPQNEQSVFEIKDISALSKIEKPSDPIKEGYVFEGWYTSELYNEDDIWNFETDAVKSDMTLYAKWVKNNDATDIEDSELNYKIIEGEGENWVIGSKKFMKIRTTGSLSKFVSLKVDGEAVERDAYNVKESPMIIYLYGEYLDNLVQGQHTLEIMWEDGTAKMAFFVMRFSDETITKKYRITFDFKNGQSVFEIKDISAFSKIEKPSDPIKEGYVFGGWYTSELCNKDDIWNFETDTVKSDMTLYAKWVEDNDVTDIEDSELKYKIIEGEGKNWVIGSKNFMKIRTTGSLSKFVSLKVDGEDVEREAYSVKESSMIIYLYGEYLDNLTQGQHTLEIMWEDGTAKMAFYVIESQNEKETPPATGDIVIPFYCVVLMICSFCVFIFCYARIKKKHI